MKKIFYKLVILILEYDADCARRKLSENYNQKNFNDLRIIERKLIKYQNKLEKL